MASPTRRVLLPEPVEQLLEKIWTEKGLTTNLEDTVRGRLASIGEEEALHLLNKVSNVSSTIRNPNAYIERMIDNHSPSPTTPVKRLTVSPLQSPSPSCSFVSPNNVRTVPSFYSPKSELPEPSRTALIPLSNNSLFSPEISTVFPHAINPPRQGETSFLYEDPELLTRESRGEKLEALGELEFRKQFLILSYCGGYWKVFVSSNY